MKKVDFLIIGVQKAGTTSLACALAGHPDLAMLEEEAHFFDRCGDLTADKIERYHKLWKESPKKYWGEKTPMYCYDASAMRRIYEYNPAMKLIFIVRDPISRAHSQWKMIQQENHTEDHIWKNVPFEHCLYRDILTRQAKTDTTKQVSQQDIVGRGDYMSILFDNVLPYFPREQLCICLFEKVKNDPEPELQRIVKFIGAASDHSFGGVLPHQRKSLSSFGDCPEHVRQFYSSYYKDSMDQFFGFLIKERIPFHAS